MFDIAIIGAGVNGALIARELAKYNVSLVVLEKCADVAMGTSGANSGIVHAGFDCKPGTLKARYNVEGCELMPQIAKELGVAYEQNGSLVVAYSQEEIYAVQELYARGVLNGVEDIEIIGREKLRELEPNISPAAVGALYARKAGIICPYGLTVAAMGNAMDNGAVLRRDFEVVAITKANGGFVISSPTDEVEADCIINAAGIYADKISALAGDTFFSIKPRRGEYLLLDKEARGMVRHTLFKAPGPMGKGILVSPTADGNIIVGPTAEDITDKEDTSTTSQGLEQVAIGGRLPIPNLPLNLVITSFAGLRAVGSTGDFIIGPSQSVPGLFQVAAMESPGLASSPAVALAVEKYLREAGILNQKKRDYDPIRRHTPRLRELPQEERERWIAKNPKYAKIICRCEEVSEGEIIDAIHANPTAMTSDGLKRRTGTGMGRCQGGFCLPLVTDILSRELAIEPEDVTKRGKGSELLVGRTK
ncbi:MAG: NAD(P)/FAD-dependent oxidoreductase [Bacillota bacterium]|nr:NAD(P)/FAD-dependent oxidoreductase [Bacillota bacterium]